MKQLISAIFIGLMALPVAAQEVRDCDGLASVDAIGEPWRNHTRTFSGNHVRLVVIDTLEPAAAAFQLVIMSPPRNALGMRQCKMVGSSGTLGFGAMSLNEITSDYDSTKGLSWGIPVRVYDANTGGFTDKILSVTLNQSNGAITTGFVR